MPATRKEKEQILSELSEQFSRMKAVVFAGYRGMSVASVNSLRKNLREQGLDYKVVKKTLLKKAVDGAKVEGFDEAVLEGPTAVVISYEDVIAAAKTIKAHAKKDEHLTILAGIMEGKMISKKDVLMLAGLPGLQELRAKFLGSLMAPLSGFVRVANGPAAGFVRILSALQKKAA